MQYLFENFFKKFWASRFLSTDSFLFYNFSIISPYVVNLIYIFFWADRDVRLYSVWHYIIWKIMAVNDRRYIIISTLFIPAFSSKTISFSSISFPFKINFSTPVFLPFGFFIFILYTLFPYLYFIEYSLFKDSLLVEFLL